MATSIGLCGTVGALEVLHVSAAENGQGVARARGGDCFLITPQHVIGDMDVARATRNQQVSSNAFLAQRYKTEDIAVLRMEADGQWACARSEWFDGRRLDTVLQRSQGYIKIATSSGVDEEYPVSVKQDQLDPSFLEVQPTKLAVRAGWSGGVVLIDNVPVGLLLSVSAAGKGRAIRWDYLDDALYAFFNSALFLELEHALKQTDTTRVLDLANRAIAQRTFRNAEELDSLVIDAIQGGEANILGVVLDLRQHSENWESYDPSLLKEAIDSAKPQLVQLLLAQPNVTLNTPRDSALVIATNIGIDDPFSAVEIVRMLLNHKEFDASQQEFEEAMINAAAEGIEILMEIFLKDAHIHLETPERYLAAMYKVFDAVQNKLDYALEHRSGHKEIYQMVMSALVASNELNVPGKCIVPLYLDSVDTLRVGQRQPGWVRYEFPYWNLSESESLRITLAITTSFLPINSIRSDRGTEIDRGTHRLTIAPGTKAVVAGELEWYAPQDDFKPQISWPDPGGGTNLDLLIKCN